MRGETIDHGIVLFFPAGGSYTGESVLELHGHGGPAVLAAVLGACIEAGARMAEAGEFTKRAFLSGRLDLAQAEAVSDLINAGSEAAARSAMRSLSGEFSHRVGGIVAALTTVRALLEAMLDFPEEDVDPFHLTDVQRRLAEIREDVRELIEQGTQGRLLRSGIHIVLAGSPNTGKSSLLNRLAGDEIAIVTSLPGTTRDVLREQMEIDGVPVNVLDTAGLRDSGDEIELIGMARTISEVKRADLVLEVFDVSKGMSQASTLEAGALGEAGVPVLPVYNKMDLLEEARIDVLSHDSVQDRVLVSARTGEGVAGLRQAILRAVGWGGSEQTVFMARERHLAALVKVRDHLAAAGDRNEDWVLLAEDLRLAQAVLGEITGRVTADDLLGEIFSRFCIGK
jgi:tRNA modification GTPase